MNGNGWPGNLVAISSSSPIKAVSFPYLDQTAVNGQTCQLGNLESQTGLVSSVAMASSYLAGPSLIQNDRSWMMSVWSYSSSGLHATERIVQCLGQSTNASAVPWHMEGQLARTQFSDFVNCLHPGMWG